MKLTDKAILGMVSKSPGRNASEPIISLVRIKVPEAEPGWKRWSRRWLYDALGLFDNYRVRPRPKAVPV